MDPRTHNQSSGDAKAGDHPAPSRSELLSSAKLVADAARAKFSHEQSKADKAELSAAAADLLNAASHYGKLEEKSYGKYVEKAENYLHKYSTSHSPTAAAAASDHHSASAQQGHSSGDSGGGYGEYMKMAEGVFKKPSAHDSTTAEAPDHHSSAAGGAHSSGNSGGGGGGYGEYIKMAEGIFNKHSATDSSTTPSHSENKYGEYAKMAGDFLKKH
ncbi:unnamed protein product [Cuscuta campestris]|uniref:Uncharacterized protein n=1 Tax=Cuscuta campestris TaxID=132261 RepID=A0A484MWA4_9ASTE|nr:unnamed protein product [Cuscuta campestris]